jgi:myo-inositol-1(or 4)-monophosphatase
MTRRDPDPDELLPLAVDLARRAAAIHREGLDRRQMYDRKSSATDLVGEVDREAERVIVDGIREARPDDAILAEEATDRSGSSGIRWLIDPLDGTVNYSRRYPVYAVSIGIEIVGHPTVGVVLDTARDRLFTGIRGHRATRDGAPIGVSEREDLATALVATGFSYRAEQRTKQAEVLRAVLPRIGDIRRGGSAALDLCSVACGEVDAYYEIGVAPWDIAGGRVVAEAAGAVVRVEASDGGAFVLAASPALAGPLAALLDEAGAPAATP